MMHEALPAGADMPFDPAAFDSAFGLLRAPLRAALAWSWGLHFRAFVADLSFLIECVPGAGDSTDDAFPGPPLSPLHAGERVRGTHCCAHRLCAKGANSLVACFAMLSTPHHAAASL